MDERQIETMPGYKPLTVVPWRTGYGVDVWCGDIAVGKVNEGFRNQYRAEFNDAFTPHRGWRNTHEYCTNEADALAWIKKQWCAFLGRVQNG